MGNRMTLSIVDMMHTYGGKGILILENPIDNKVFITYSSDLLTYFARLLSQLESGTHSNKELIKDKDKLLINYYRLNYKNKFTYLFEMNQIIKEYRSKGYAIYNNIKPFHPIVKTEVIASVVHIYVGVFIQIKNKRRKYTVKLCKNTIEAESFVQYHSIQQLLEMIDEKEFENRPTL